MSWFNFSNETLEKLMRRLARWYDFEVEYLTPEVRYYHFSGTLDRYDNISNILEMIALTTHISIEVENNKVVTIKKKI